MARHRHTDVLRLADLHRQGFMKRSSVRTWVVAVESTSGDPADATYIEVQARNEKEALRVARQRKPLAQLTVRYIK